MKIKTIRMLGLLIATLSVLALVVHASRLYEREVHQNDYLTKQVQKLHQSYIKLEHRIWESHKK